MTEILWIIRKNSILPVTVTVYTAIFTLYLWITEPSGFLTIACGMYLTVIIITVFIMFFIVQKEMKCRKKLMTYIDNPDETNEEELIHLCSRADRELILKIGKVIRKKDYENKKYRAEAAEYENYVENWAHEIKIPLSLLTMIIDNHTDKIPLQIIDRLDCVRKQVKEYVEQMMMYSKLNCGRKDYYFENVDIKECIDEIIEDNRAVLDEKGIIVKTAIDKGTVYTDKRGIKYIISQAISNSIKYTVDGDETPQVIITFKKAKDSSANEDFESKERMDSIIIQDNGIGVKESELPFIFEKGFTGTTGSAGKYATGMGLYIVKEISHDLNIDVDVSSKWQHGFSMKIQIPAI